MRPVMWIRLYADFLHNRKIATLSEHFQVRCVKFWLIHAQGHLRGATDKEIAYDLHITPEEVAETRKVLQAAKLLDRNGLPVNWDERQYASDHSADRTSRWRHKRRHGDGSVTSHRRRGDVPEQSRAEQSRAEGTGRASGAPASPRPASRGGGVRLATPRQIAMLEGMAEERGITVADAAAACGIGIPPMRLADVTPLKEWLLDYSPDRANEPTVDELRRRAAENGGAA